MNENDGLPTTGWQWAALGDLVTDASNGLYKPDTFYGRGTPILKMFNIGRLDGSWNLGRVDRLAVTPKEHEQFGLADGDLLVNRVNSRELVGKCAVVNADTAGAVFESKNMRVRIERSRANPEWVALWLNSEFGRAQIERFAQQAVGQATINRSHLDAIKVPVPPLAEQRRIAARLREELAAVTAARAALKAQLSAAVALPAACLRETFPKHADNGSPTHKLASVLSLRNDIMHPRNRPTGSGEFVGLEHIESHTGRRLGSVRVDFAKLTGRKTRFAPRDIVYGYLRPYLNKVWLADSEGICSVDQYVFRVNPQRGEPGYVAHFLRSPAYLDAAPIDRTQGQLPRIRTDEVLSVTIPLPSLAEQRVIAARLDAELAAAHTIRERLEERLAAVEKMPAMLLRAAFAPVTY
ncbi:MAG: restriction endonuclease subunit S [Chthoniobacteraceae bacterium]